MSIKLTQEQKEKCTLCQVCTHHIFNTVTGTWSRCDKTDQTLFHAGAKTLPPRYMQSTWESFITDNSLKQEALKYAQTVYKRISVEHTLPKRSLLLSGKSYTTHLASILIRALLLDDIDASFCSLGVLTDLYFNDKAAYSAALRPAVLCVTLSNEISTNALPLVLKDLYDARLDNNLYTLFTSTSSRAEMVHRYNRDDHDTVGKDMLDFFSSSSIKELLLR